MTKTTSNFTTNTAVSDFALNAVSKVIGAYRSISKSKSNTNSVTAKKENLIYLLNHDFKVALLAQQRALDTLSNLKQNEREEICEDISNSNRFILEMLEMLTDIYSQTDNFDYELIDLSEIIGKNLKNNFITELNSEPKKYILKADKKRLSKAVNILLELVVQYSIKNDEYKLSLKKLNKKTELSLTFSCRKPIAETIDSMFDEYPQYSSVGQGIKIQFFNKVIERHNCQMCVENLDNNVCKLKFEFLNFDLTACGKSSNMDYDNSTAKNNTQPSMENCVLKK